MSRVEGTTQTPFAVLAHPDVHRSRALRPPWMVEVSKVVGTT